MIDFQTEEIWGFQVLNLGCSRIGEFSCPGIGGFSCSGIGGFFSHPLFPASEPWVTVRSPSRLQPAFAECHLCGAAKEVWGVGWRGGAATVDSSYGVAPVGCSHSGVSRKL